MMVSKRDKLPPYSQIKSMTTQQVNGELSIDELTRSGVYKRLDYIADRVNLYPPNESREIKPSSSPPIRRVSVINDW